MNRLLALVLFVCSPLLLAGNTLVPEGVDRYQPTAFPDRIALTPGANPAREMAVSWRTARGGAEPRVQIARAGDSPNLAGEARELRGQTLALDSVNGPADQHQVRLTDLLPGQLYAYRVRGDGTWSEWFQFRTPREDFAPFSFIYFGDAQNSVKSLFSRVIREAWRDQPDAQLLIHAGDLVDQRAGRHDDEWGEWFDAGGFLLAMTPNLPAAGNHEYVKADDGDAYAGLGPHWRASFLLPGNGSPAAPESSYFVDMQGVRFIVLDSLSALDLNTAAAQAEWLEPLLANNPNRWTVVIQHHPMFSASLGRDNPLLRSHWQPLFARYRVDLVLQGHDHVYGRGGNLPEGSSRADEDSGTVYVVSVAGAKMYRVADEARAGMDRVGEETQLYQIIHVEADRLRYQSHTASGGLYDHFHLVRQEDGGNRLVERPENLLPQRDCQQEASGSGRRSRCWDGVEWGLD